MDASMQNCGVTGEEVAGAPFSPGYLTCPCTAPLIFGLSGDHAWTQSLPWKLRAPPFRVMPANKSTSIGRASPSFLQSVFCFCSVATSSLLSMDASRHLRSSVGDHCCCCCCLLVFFFSPFALSSPRPISSFFMRRQIASGRPEEKPAYCIQIQIGYLSNNPHLVHV